MVTMSTTICDLTMYYVAIIDVINPKPHATQDLLKISTTLTFQNPTELSCRGLNDQNRVWGFLSYNYSISCPQTLF